MDQRAVALLLVGLGAALLLAGVLVLVGGFSWFGRLPGDLSWRSGGTRVYLPLASMLLISVVLNLLLYLVRRLH